MNDNNRRGNPQGRYLLLVAHQYYPSGWNDYSGRYDTIDEARSEWKEKEESLKQYWIVDLETNDEVETGYGEDEPTTDDDRYGGLR